MGESLEMQQYMVEKYVQGQGDMRLQGVYRDDLPQKFLKPLLPGQTVEVLR